MYIHTCVCVLMYELYIKTDQSEKHITHMHADLYIYISAKPTKSLYHSFRLQIPANSFFVNLYYIHIM